MTATSPLQTDPPGSSPDLVDLSRTLELPILSTLQTVRADTEYMERFEIGFSRDHLVMAVRSVEDPTGELLVALGDYRGWQQIDTIVRWLDKSVRPLLVQPKILLAFINVAYSQRDSQADHMLRSMGTDELVEAALKSSAEDLLDTTGRAPIIRLVNQILLDSVMAGASDIHIQPAEDRVLVRQRIDGVLFDAYTLPKSIQEEVLSRVKVLGQMNIAEKRLPQDGRATVELGDRLVDLRIASLPTSHNERIVIRLLDKSARLYTLGELGMTEQTLVRWRQLIRRDHGLILVTGPTGSGKSTTLYGALQEINSKELNVLTLEDPIEYQLSGISQSQINERKGLTFASGMRSILRQDPDIIMVGEIRDRETATMAIQASLTGHLVFSTLHTNDAASAATRLLDLGVEPYLVASSLVASLAQRLIRRLCLECRRPIGDADGTQPSNQIDQFEPGSCGACRQTGFNGRIGLFELLVVDDACRDLIQNRANATALREQALQAGMSLLATDGIDKARAGQTTLAEVLRATTIESENGLTRSDVAVYFYSGLDARRVAIQGTILAESPRQARDRLRDQGVIVEAISERPTKVGSLLPAFEFGIRSARKHWGLGAHELSMLLLGAGVTLTEALEIIAGQHRGPFRSAVLRLKGRIEAGSSLADAMGEQPEIFDPASIRLVEVGENAGTLEQVLAEIAEFKLQLAGFQDRVTTALLYPIFLGCFGTAAMIFLMTWVMPPLLESLEETLTVLPWPTRAARALSNLFVNYGVWLLSLLGIAIAGLVIWLRSGVGRRFADRTILKIPVIGPLVLKQAVSRAAMIIALLTRGGVLLTTAVDLAAKSMRNSVIQQALMNAGRDMSAGESLATSLERSGCFPPLAVRFFSVGQDSGKLDDMLQRLSRDYNSQVATATARLTALVEPVLILVLAAAVGFLLLATILPILEAGNVP